MNLRLLTFLADENIHPHVIEWMRSQGIPIQSVHEVGLGGTDDLTIIRRAVAASQVILTHDSDFGTLAVAGLEPIFGIVYLRPGPHQTGVHTRNFAHAVRHGYGCATGLSDGRPSPRYGPSCPHSHGFGVKREKPIQWSDAIRPLRSSCVFRHVPERPIRRTGVLAIGQSGRSPANR